MAYFRHARQLMIWPGVFGSWLLGTIVSVCGSCSPLSPYSRVSVEPECTVIVPGVNRRFSCWYLLMANFSEANVFTTVPLFAASPEASATLVPTAPHASAASSTYHFLIQIPL